MMRRSVSRIFERKVRLYRGTAIVLLPTGTYEAYVRYAPGKGDFLQSDSLQGIKQSIIAVLTEHNLGNSL